MNVSNGILGVAIKRQLKSQRVEGFRLVELSFADTGLRWRGEMLLRRQCTNRSLPDHFFAGTADYLTDTRRASVRADTVYLPYREHRSISETRAPGPIAPSGLSGGSALAHQFNSCEVDGPKQRSRSEGTPPSLAARFAD